jgi:tRNA nucleotidyltransferase (CCA-adding enzyme)
MLILGEGDPAEPVRLLIEWGILSSMVPGWNPPEDTPDILGRALLLMNEAGADDLRSSADRKLTLMLALLQPVSQEVRERAAERLSAGRRLRELLRQLQALEEGALEELETSGDLPRSAIYRRLRTCSAEAIVVSLAVSRSDALTRRLRLYASRLWDAGTELDGATLTRLGLPQGRALGELLDAVLDARLDGKVSTLDEEIALARSMAPGLTPPERTDNVSGAEEL